MRSKEKNPTLIQPKQVNHHDVFFKDFYSDPTFALELFQLIFSKEELEAYNWSQLKTEKDTLKDKRADLVFSVPLKEDDKIHLKIFILLEHKSSYNKELFTQLLHYQTLIHTRTLQETGHPAPVIPVVFYHGKTPWKWSLSFQKTFFGEFLDKIPALSRENMLNYTIKLLNVYDPKIEKVFEDHHFKSRGALYLLKKVWSLKADMASIKGVMELFKDFAKKRDDLIVSMMSYLKTGLRMSDKMWKETEKMATEMGLFQNGGYMTAKERLKEEGREEGREELILKMLREELDISLVSKVTGLSEEEIRKLKNGS